MLPSLACSSRAATVQAVSAPLQHGAAVASFRSSPSAVARPRPGPCFSSLYSLTGAPGPPSSRSISALGLRSFSHPSASPGWRSGRLSSLPLRTYATYPPGQSPPPQLAPPPAQPPRPTSVRSYLQRLTDRRNRRSSDQPSAPYQRVPLPPLPAILRRRFVLPLLVLSILILASTASYNLIPATRHFAQAVLRCGRLMYAVLLDAVDYKRTFAKEFTDDAERLAEHKACHLRSAKRMLSALEVSPRAEQPMQRPCTD